MLPCQKGNVSVCTKCVKNKQFSSSFAALNCFPSSYKVSHIYIVCQAQVWQVSFKSSSSSSLCQSPIPHSTLGSAIQVLLPIPMLQPPFDYSSRYSLPQFHPSPCALIKQDTLIWLSHPDGSGTCCGAPITIRTILAIRWSQTINAAQLND